MMETDAQKRRRLEQEEADKVQFVRETEAEVEQRRLNGKVAKAKYEIAVTQGQVKLHHKEAADLRAKADEQITHAEEIESRLPRLRQRLANAERELAALDAPKRSSLVPSVLGL